ncbi:23S rRNA (guanosine(2251)-2'-O)-methyltransferase RlmB [Estrella lausannensis]|uniref:Putative 23S rRNA (Guanosine-2'-O-)-methyltransferase n=1 Tax=Estrella lausannensis TaxID=483423 RepID=A0A0H5DQJ5_9BACT|nr:23S rRNA (guanosine(2251)-2'-O)-methyltransferase RlmB [Estrella lausannensis]CRX38353.1 putative 23S rRNA (guanosine-2'-O-)-methyltransferase [Estrella lausannensis]
MNRKPRFRENVKPARIHFSGSLVIGNRAVREVLSYKPKAVAHLYFAKKEDGLEEDMLKIARDHQIQLHKVSKDELTSLAGTDSHQGIAAAMRGSSQISLDEFMRKHESKDRTLLVALDSIYDPQNLGAIMRAAECFGAAGVMWSKNRGVDLTPSATKASAGACELLDVVKVSNLVQAVQELKEDGFEVVAADASSDAGSLTDFIFPPKCILLLGSEGEGIRPLLLKQADHRVFIPMLGKIASLNVSQAGAVMLSWWARGA